MFLEKNSGVGLLVCGSFGSSGEETNPCMLGLTRACLMSLLPPL